MILDSFRLTGRLAVVTGGRRGLGQAAAVALAEAGADIVLVERGPATETEAIVSALGREVYTIEHDLSRDTDELGDLIDDIAARHGRLDILVNNAGTIIRAPAVSYAQEDWDSVLRVNLDAVFALSQAAGRHQVAAGRGRIINIASMLSFQGGIRVPAYTASKHAVVGLTKALANEWGQSGVTVNAIAPGYMATNNTHELRNDPERETAILARIPQGRWGTPEDLAGCVVFLASEASAYVTGAVIPVDGGWLAR